MKERKSNKKKIYKIVELYDFPDYIRENYTVINFFKYLNQNNNSFEISKEEMYFIAKKYKKKYINNINVISQVVNIYIECSEWDLLSVGEGEADEDYIVTFFKYV